MDIDAFRQMVAKNPKGFLGRYGLGNKILQQGSNLEEAVEHLTVATQLDPTHVASHLGLGRALVSLGRKDEAKPVLQAGIDAARSGRSSGDVRRPLRASRLPEEAYYPIHSAREILLDSCRPFAEMHQYPSCKAPSWWGHYSIEGAGSARAHKR